MNVKAALGFGVVFLVEGGPGMAGGGLVWKDLEPGASAVQRPGACSLGTRSKAQAWSESWFRPCHLTPLAPPPKASQGSSDLSAGKPWVCGVSRKGPPPFPSWVTLCICDSGLSVGGPVCLSWPPCAQRLPIKGIAWS